MKNIFLTIIFILISGLLHKSLAQTETKKFLLRGYVIGADTNNTIPLANILKKPTGERYISNRYGAFGIQVLETDTLVFSVIGYATYYLPVKKYVVNNMTDPIRVRLKPTTYKLKQAEVNYNQRKRDSVAREAAIILKTSPLLNDYYHVNSWIAGSSGSLVTDMFASSNSKLQEYYKLNRLIELYREQGKVDERYTNDIIMRATGIDESKILELKKFCNLPNYFVLNSNDYDLVLAIKACYSDYLRQQR
ncbi:MAG: carboxypeptidase-like regulatory domain-containing protein [Bacteroidia bacterium]|nr:carboxypeptidase-like regulatory domain-containing protein [Bacteroidia bacterium]MCF8427560.1 carboxypeptidase-like regulatory domain-containing protein [Bacteroidia bacterium]MCF8447697.1 carboxypeptidase-like regulatory domain-containing protein [Bacteroidia bacterium]